MNRATDTDKAVAHETGRWDASGDRWPYKIKYYLPLTLNVIVVNIVIGMMILFKCLLFFSVAFSEDSGYALIGHRNYKEMTENIEPVKMEAGHDGY
tara:strand:+ start:447 stop:734 length:288 start_codon:yes stop_codon:yes gene_type:complete